MKQELITYIKAGFPGLFLATQEEERAKLIMQEVAKETKFGLYCWTFTKGIVNATDGNNVCAGQDPQLMLTKFGELPEDSILLVFDLPMMLFGEPNPALYRMVKDALSVGKRRGLVLLLVGSPPMRGWPRELEKEFTHVDLSLPDGEMIGVALDGIIASANQSNKACKLSLVQRAELIQAASGLTMIEAENAFAASISSLGKIDPTFVAREKAAIVRKGGLLEIVDSPETMDDIGGLAEGKKWIGEVVRLWSPDAEKYGIILKPRGVIVIGPSGSGKSLFSKAIRGAMETILIRMDIGKLKGSLVGESESRMRAALAQIEAIGKCVVWIDEVEKALAAVGKNAGTLDGGASAGQFDALLYKLEEGLKGAFFVLTCNDSSKLPPEFLQRFEDMFFVDLPHDDERKEIFSIWMRKTKRDPKDFDLAKLAKATERFSGREIRKAWLAAMRKAFVAGVEVSTAHVLAAAKEIIPTSKSRAAEYDALKEWAKTNARPANTPVEDETLNPAARAARRLS